MDIYDPGFKCLNWHILCELNAGFPISLFSLLSVPLALHLFPLPSLCALLSLACSQGATLVGLCRGQREGFLYKVLKLHFECIDHILGDPGAASRDDGIFMGESLQQRRESPWVLTLTERVPEAFEIPPSDWPAKFFLANQRRGTAGRLSCLLTRGCFPDQSP